MLRVSGIQIRGEVKADISATLTVPYHIARICGMK
jgi:hypothetical protein